MANKEHIQLWVDALRSGEYQQARSALKTSEGYCCLGVACEVYQKEVGDLDVTRPIKSYLYDNRGGSLPAKVVAWLDVWSPNPTLAPGVTATALNDFRRWDFNQIADAIEQTYLSGGLNMTNHLNEAQELVDNNPGAAQVHALISIAQSLDVLAAAVEELNTNVRNLDQNLYGALVK